MSKLIYDSFSHGELKLLTETVDNHPSKPNMYVIEGIYARADSVNGNGRSYPYELLKREMDRFNEEYVKTGRALGNLEHPQYPEIRPNDAAIRILSLHEDKKSWIGKSCILATQNKYDIKGTPQGDLLLSLIQHGTRLGFSTRSLGDLSEDGTEVVDLKLMTIDCVTNPSIQEFCDSNGNRFVNGILESKDFLCNTHGTIMEHAYSQFESALDKSPNTYISSKKLAHVKSAFDDFLAAITQG